MVCLFRISIALDDFWAIQLDKMDTFTCLRPLEMEINPADGSDSSDDDGDEEEDDDDGVDDGDGNDNDEEAEPEGEDEGADAKMEAVILPTQVGLSCLTRAQY